MRYMLYADPHWSCYSSIIRGRGEKYSIRLENLIETINWVEDTALNCECDCVFCLGDFFDRYDLDGEEISALKDIRWNKLPHQFLCGNHELEGINNIYNTSNIFNLCDFSVIQTPSVIYDGDNFIIFALPYIAEKNRKSLCEYINNCLTETQKNKNLIIFSHNDLKGMKIGAFTTDFGFDVEEIKNNCAMFVNGHIHNESIIDERIINIGNVTGQNFGENAFKFRHKVMILDTDCGKIDFIENPYAFNFYKIDLSEFTKDSSENDIKKCLNLPNKYNVLSLVTSESGKDIVKNCVNSFSNIVSSRITINYCNAPGDGLKDKWNLEKNSIDYLKKFEEYIKETYKNTPLLLDELKEILS